MKDKLVLCMKWGDAYGPAYVNKLYAMVRRHLAPPFSFVCFTENPSGIEAKVQCLPLPEFGCEVPPGSPGKWRKQSLWAPCLGGLSGPALFVDLDSVLVDSIDPYFECGNDDDVITARDWVKPHRRICQTSVFRFKIGSHPYLLDDLRRDPSLMLHYRFEQRYLTARLRTKPKFWPEAWTRHFRLHCMGPGPVRFFRAPVIPRGARIITFPGDVKPLDAALGRWSSEMPSRSLREHLRWVVSGEGAEKRLRKRLSRFVRPSPWISAWTEADQAPTCQCPRPPEP